MTPTYGVTETPGAEIPQLVAGDFHAMKKVTIASGEGQLTRGTLLAKDKSPGWWGNAVKFLAMALVTQAGPEVVDTGDGTTTSFSFTLANAPVIPWVVDITTTVGSMPLSAKDDGEGKISGSGSGNTVSGTINYATGEVSLTYSTAPDNGADLEAIYNYGDAAAYRHLPAAILAEDVDASAEDKEAQVYFAGAFREDDISWPSGVGFNHKRLVREWLQDRGIILK